MEAKGLSERMDLRIRKRKQRIPSKESSQSAKISLCSCISVTVRALNGKSEDDVGFLDGGSTGTLISEYLAFLLDLNIGKRNRNRFKTFNGQIFIVTSLGDRPKYSGGSRWVLFITCSRCYGRTWGGRDSTSSAMTRSQSKISSSSGLGAVTGCHELNQNSY